MIREWKFYDYDIISSELSQLPAAESAKLASLMHHYRTVGNQNPAPAQIDDYGDGIKRLRHIKSAYQGRILFSVGERSAGYEKLIVLTVYKKEGMTVPNSVLQRAIKRKKQFDEMENK